MKKLILILLLLCSSYTYGQIGIGISSPENSSILDIVSDSLGILIPRVDLSVNPVYNPKKSLLVWNTDQANGNANEGFFYFDGTSWQSITSVWKLTGNTGTNPTNHFVGTTDNQRLVIKTNNINRLVVGNEVAGTSFTTLSANINPNTAYSGTINGFTNGVDLQSGSSAANVYGIENMLYLRSGTTITGTFRAQRNRLWNVQTAGYPNVVGVLNEYRGEVTDITTYKGFQNTYDFRSGSNITDCYGFLNEFPGQINGTITNFYGLFNSVHSSVNNYTNYYGYFQQNLGTGTSKYAFFYDGNGSTTQKVVITSLGRIGIGTTSPTSYVHSSGSISLGYLATGTLTGILNLNESHYTLRVFNDISTINLPDPSTCTGRVYIIIGTNGISDKNLTVNGSGMIYDDVTSSNISTIGSNQRIQVQSDGAAWYVIGN